jgi:hypothetical protein
MHRVTMTKDQPPAGFKNLDSRFLQRQESVRDDIAFLLGDALHTCPEDQRSRHVERAFMIYESHEVMHSLLWKGLELRDQGPSDSP